MSLRSRRLLLAALARAALPVGLAGAALAARAQDRHGRVPPLEAWHGRVPPPGVGGALDLIDQRGQRFALARMAGRPVLVFFGFTHCGSTCPLALATARELLRAAPPGDAPAVVFVTLDPLADQPEQLRTFVERIDARIVALTGSPQQIEQAAERYGVGVRGHAGALEHSSMFYLLDGAARVRRVYPHTTTAAALLADVRRLQGGAA
jgi:protein SCO1/2